MLWTATLQPRGTMLVPLGVSAQLVTDLSCWAILSVCFTHAGRIGHSLQEELCQSVGMSPALNQVWLPILRMVAST